MSDPISDAMATARLARDHLATFPDTDSQPHTTAELLRSAADAIDQLAAYVGIGVHDKVAAWERYRSGFDRLQCFAQTGLLRTAGRAGDDLADIAIATIQELHQENANLRVRLASSGKHLRSV